MAKIKGFRIKNFRVLKDVTLGRLWNQQETAPLTPLTAVIGKNGVGKSTVFDAFGFLADCLKSGNPSPSFNYFLKKLRQLTVPPCSSPQ